jgi:type IV pilus assembly protein PilX
MDAEFDIRGPNTFGGRRIDEAFGGEANKSALPERSMFSITGCNTSVGDKTRGLCAFVDETMAVSGQKQKWLTADFTNDGNNAETAAFGDFTDRKFSFGGTGVRSVRLPRYIIEPVRDYGDFLESRNKSEAPAARYMYRVTSMGFGPRQDIQAVAQMILRP